MQPRRPLPPPQLKQEKVRPSRPLPPLPQPQQLKQETVRVATSAAASSVQQANFRAYPSSIAPADALSSTAAGSWRRLLRSADERVRPPIYRRRLLEYPFRSSLRPLLRCRVSARRFLRRFRRRCALRRVRQLGR